MFGSSARPRNRSRGYFPIAISARTCQVARFLLLLSAVQSERLLASQLRSSEVLRTQSRTVPLVFFRSRRARRYILRVTDEGVARVTIPRGGSQESARIFARQHAAWVQKQLYRLASGPRPDRVLACGSEVLYRGTKTVLKLNTDGHVQVGDQTISLSTLPDDLTALVRGHLWRLAMSEFTVRTFELAKQYGLPVKRVYVRNQRTRWGSCSIRGTICLNWRLIQAPAFVRDYLIIHELMHLREMNHSVKFWQHVASVCSRYEEAEQWLDDHDHLLRQG